MGRSKLKLTSLFSKLPTNNGGERDITTPTSSSSLSSTSSSSSWAWPSCKQPRTDSFRFSAGPGPSPTNTIFKTINSVYCDSTEDHCCSSDDDDESESESLIRNLARPNRLFFEPRGRTSSILEQEGNSRVSFSMSHAVPFKESVAMAMESQDPYGDFRRSMEEMVAAHGMKRWDHLEELLVWYLRVNGKKNHGFIVGAFVDLLVALASPAETETSCCCGCNCSSCSNSLSSMSFEIEEVDEDEEEDT